MLRQTLIEFHGGIIAHSLLTAFHSRYLDYYSQISAGLYRDRIRRYIKSEDIGSLLLESESVINLILVPVLELDDEIDLFALLYRTDTEYTAYIHYTYTAKLHIMLDDLRRRADECFFRDTLYLNGIIRDKPMTALYQLDCRFALAYATVSENKDPFAVYFDENAMAAYARSEVNIQRSDGGRLKAGRS